MKKIIVSGTLLLSAIIVGIRIVCLVFPGMPVLPRAAEDGESTIEAPRVQQIAEVESSWSEGDDRFEVISEGLPEEEEESASASLSETLGDAFFTNLERIRDLEEPLGEAGVAAFKAMFDALDADEKNSYAHHAANLIPDENIACLKAILTDVSEPQDVLETIYYDLLNRPEEIKNPILREVAELESHPLRDEAFEVLSDETKE